MQAWSLREGRQEEDIMLVLCIALSVQQLLLTDGMYSSHMQKKNARIAVHVMRCSSRVSNALRKLEWFVFTGEAVINDTR